MCTLMKSEQPNIVHERSLETVNSNQKPLLYQVIPEVGRVLLPVHEGLLYHCCCPLAYLLQRNAVWA